MKSKTGKNLKIEVIDEIKKSWVPRGEKNWIKIGKKRTDKEKWIREKIEYR